LHKAEVLTKTRLGLFLSLHIVGNNCVNQNTLIKKIKQNEKVFIINRIDDALDDRRHEQCRSEPLRVE
jgi:hypothetical protein